MRRFLSVLVVSLFAMLPQLASAQPAPTATLNTVDECYVGDVAPLRISIANASTATPPDLESILGRDWIVQFLGMQPSASNMTIIINGKMQEQRSQSVLFAYTISPRAAGKFTIPAIEVDVAGRALRTQPATITVSQPAAADGMGTALDHSRVYVGQPSKLTISWVLNSGAEDIIFNLNLQPDTFDVRPLAPSSSQPSSARQLADLDYLEGPGSGGGKVRGSITQANIDGETRTRVTAEFLLTPKRAGRFDCGAVRVDFAAVVGQRPRSRLDAPWESRNITQRRFAMAPAKSLEVIELPIAGRPANFSGLIGQFDLDAECQPRQAAVGDPLTLTLVLRGKHLLIDPPTLDLSRQNSGSGVLAEQFRVPRDPVLPQVADNAAIYSAQIRPRSATITELPPVELWYFDPAESAYRVARSNRLPLKITAAPVVGLGTLEALADESDDIHSADRAAGSPSDRGSVQAAAPERIDGFFPPLASAVAPLPISADRGSTAIVPAASIAIAIPTTVWIAGAFLAARRRLADRDPAAWRRRGSARRAERAIRHAAPDDTAAISAALRAFVADWFNLPPETVTSGEAILAVQSIHPVLASRIRGILDSCDLALFGPDRATRTDPGVATDAAALIREITRAPHIQQPPFASSAGSGGSGGASSRRAAA